MKALEGTINQGKALVVAFSVITNLRINFFEALENIAIIEMKWEVDDDYCLINLVLRNSNSTDDKSNQDCI